MFHRLTEIDTETRTARCSACGWTTVQSKGRNPGGGKKWRCTAVDSVRKRDRNWPGHEYRDWLKPRCERCNFKPEDFCQLDIHHRDGNRNNNSRENLQTLCANCHRIVTKNEIFAARKASLDRRKKTRVAERHVARPS